MTPHDKQPVSLADELRKLEERWRDEHAAFVKIGGEPEHNDYATCADQLSALLAQHAVAEPDEYVPHGIQADKDRQRRDFRVGDDVLIRGKIVAEDGSGEFRVKTEEGRIRWILKSALLPAHAAEQPKLTEADDDKP